MNDELLSSYYALEEEILELRAENTRLREENKWMETYAEWGEGSEWRKVMEQALKGVKDGSS